MKFWAVLQTFGDGFWEGGIFQTRTFIKFQDLKQIKLFVSKTSNLIVHNY